MWQNTFTGMNFWSDVLFCCLFCVCSEGHYLTHDIFIPKLLERFYMIMFTVWASSSEPMLIMWLMWGSCILDKNQIQAPFGQHTCFHHDLCLWLELACGPWNCTLGSIVHVGKRAEFCLGIRDQRDVKSDSRSAGGPLVCTALCLVLEHTSKREQQKSSSPHVLHIWLLVGTVSDNGCWLFYLCF